MSWASVSSRALVGPSSLACSVVMPAVAVALQALLHDVGRAEQVGAHAELDRHPRRGLLPLAVEPQRLHRGDVVGEALAGEGVVVEVLVRRPHRPDRERVAAGVAGRRLLDVVGELDGDRHHEVDVVEGPAAACGAGAQRFEEHLGMLGDERVAEPPVGELARQFEVARSEGGDVHGYVGRREHRAQRPTRAVGQRQLVDLPVVLDPVATGDGANDVDRLPGRRHGCREPDAVPALHHLRPARADAEQEPSAGEVLHRHRRHRQQRRRP